MTQTTAADVYRRNAILTASPEKLVVLLYEGAIRNMEKCRQGLSDPATCRSAATGEALGKAYSIIGELRTALDHEAGGEISTRLDQLYDFTLQQLHTANVERRPEPVEHGLRVMRTLKEGWDAIVPA